VGLVKKRKESNPGFGKYSSIAIYQKSQKSKYKTNDGNNHRCIKTRRANKGQKAHNPQELEKGRELILLVEHIPKAPREML
jgi:hypothetical protein